MLRLATRSSRLAVTQTEEVARLLRAAGFETELVLIDPAEERRRAGGDDKGRFTRGVERALLEGRADIGVHSAKDLPGRLPAGLVLAGATPRAAVSDALITAISVQEGAISVRKGPGLRERLARLRPGARIGTASLRRRSQLLALREDLVVEELRGNVETRLRRLDDGELDAIVLATAGLRRLGLADVIEAEAVASEILPAPGQGTLALEIPSGADEARAAVGAISSPAAFAALRAERAVGAGLEADCDTPLGALATVSEAGRLRLEGYVGRADGGDWIRDRIEGPLDEAEALGTALAERMIAAGANEILGRS